MESDMMMGKSLKLSEMIDGWTKNKNREKGDH